MKKIVMIFAMLLAFVCGMAKDNGPVISLEKNKIDFGTVEQTSGKVECVFEFTNTGDAPLVIVSARSSCGCTTPHYPDAPIAPGEKGEITLQFDPRAQMGEINKTVTVRTNDRAHKKLTLRITGMVVRK